MTFTQQRNRLTTRFLECIPAVEQCMAIQSLLEGFLSRSLRLFVDDGVIGEQSQEDENPALRSHLQYTNQTLTRRTHFQFLPPDVRFQYSATSRHDTTTSDWMVLPYTRHFIVQLGAYNFMDILHLYNKLFRRYVTYPSKNTSPKDGHNGWLKHVGGYAVYKTVNVHILIRACWSYIA